MATEQTQKMITVTSKAAEKIQEFMKEEAEAPEFLEYTFKVVVVLVYHMVWDLRKHQKRTTWY